MKIYTKSGDDGTTGLLYGGRVAKDDLRTDSYGSVDEAVAAIGLARSHGPTAAGLDVLLLRIQRELFVVGAELATAKENASKLKPGISKVTEDHVAALEADIDRITDLSPLPNNFIVPGANQVSAAIDLARAIVRRAERAVTTMQRGALLEDEVVLRYLNRLSDLLFVCARFEERARGQDAPASR